MSKHSETDSVDDMKSFKNDCPGYDYLPTVVPAVDKIVAIGDLHGDYDLMIQTLLLTEVIDKDNKWIGGDTVVVQVGDQVDRCRPTDKKCDHAEATIDDEASDVKIMEFMTLLHRQAISTGGAVYSLLGNHELMNAMGNMNYASHAGIEEFKEFKDSNNPDRKFESSMAARKYAFTPGNKYANFMGCTRISAIIVGSNLFVHAGLLPSYAREIDLTDRKGLEKINKSVRKWLLGHVNEEYVSTIVSSSKISMFWNRILGNIPPNLSNEHPDCQKYLKPVMKMLHLNHMIVGHTPQFHANKTVINATCSDTLLRVDNGGSKAFSQFDPLSSEGGVSDSRVPQAAIIKNDTDISFVTQSEVKST